MKPYPSYLKEKERYALFTIKSGKKHPYHEVTRAINNSVLRHIGEKGAADADYRIIEYDEKEQKGILRANAHKMSEIIASTALLQEISGEPAGLETHSVSGTLKKLREANIKKTKLIEQTIKETMEG